MHKQQCTYHHQQLHLYGQHTDGAVNDGLVGTGGGTGSLDDILLNSLTGGVLVGLLVAGLGDGAVLIEAAGDNGGVQIVDFQALHTHGHGSQNQTDGSADLLLGLTAGIVGPDAEQAADGLLDDGAVHEAVQVITGTLGVQVGVVGGAGAGGEAVILAQDVVVVAVGVDQAVALGIQAGSLGQGVTAPTGGPVVDLDVGIELGGVAAVVDAVVPGSGDHAVALDDGGILVDEVSELLVQGSAHGGEAHGAVDRKQRAHLGRCSRRYRYQPHYK